MRVLAGRTPAEVFIIYLGIGRRAPATRRRRGAPGAPPGGGRRSAGPQTGRPRSHRPLIPVVPADPSNVHPPSGPVGDAAPPSSWATRKQTANTADGNRTLRPLACYEFTCVHV
ncbi:hypothetical protein EVAR_48440_1 [Eumeta japonica]|uniref:Uncharacterized protein n=1 Tax=Eumeta variegata TaxID=151549 RepID=A0A4C1XU65_EUMVA|nr:hypothetical protein EVAR_48440_1 [Eumeta japonica]